MRASRCAAAAVLGCVGVGAATGPARAFDPDDDRAVRVLVESGSGLGGGAIGAMGGALVGLGLCAAGGGDHREWGCFGPALLGAGIGAWWGMAGGVTLAGDGMGGNGGFGWELLGQLAGTGAAALVFVALDDLIDSEALWVTTWIALPLAGGVLGYELSTSSDAPAAARGAFVVPLGFRF